MLKTNDWNLLAADLEKQYGVAGENPDFFDHDALVIDFSQLAPDMPLQDLKPLLRVLRSCRLVPLAVRGASTAWMQSALALGLVEAPVDAPRVRPATATTAPTEYVVQEVVREIVREIPGQLTMVVDKPLRSGQKIYARGADLVVLAMVNQGAEVVADGKTGFLVEPGDVSSLSRAIVGFFRQDRAVSFRVAIEQGWAQFGWGKVIDMTLKLIGMEERQPCRT